MHKYIRVLALTLIVPALALALGACAKKAPAEVVPSPTMIALLKAEVVTFCREDADADVKTLVDALQKKGLTYKGVLNANGLNCNRVLFTN